MKEWNHHNPLQYWQLDSAGRIAIVQSAGFSHSGIEMYWLIGVPGTWHEACLERIEPGDAATICSVRGPRTASGSQR